MNTKKSKNDKLSKFDFPAWKDLEIERTPDPRGLGPAVFEAMDKHKDMIGQIEATSGNSETHGEMKLRAIRAAEEMTARGITHNDFISICTENNMDCCIPFLAGLFLGAKVAPFDPMLSVRDCTHLIKLIKPKILFCGPEAVELMEVCIEKSNLNVQLVVFGPTTDYISFSEFQKITGTETNFKPKSSKLDEITLVYFTSGSTGLPKGVCLTHYGLLHQTMVFTTKIITLSFTRLYWISGALLLLWSIFGGGSRIIINKLDHKTLFKYIHDYEVEMMFITPYYSYLITQKPEYNTYDISCLKMLFLTGGLIFEKQILKLRSFFPHAIINLGYGLTETSGAGTRFVPSTDMDLIKSKPQSCGRILKGDKFKVIDLETNEVVRPNHSGELYIKSPGIMKGYYKNPEATEQVFDDEGYFKTGDIVYYDEDDCFYVVDRIKDMMKFQSRYITPGELEEILLKHGDVKEAVVVALPHEIDGDHPAGVVVLKEGSKCTEETLLKFVESQVLDYKRLRGGVRFVKEIPTTPTGKFKRREIRDMILQQKI